ncbi:MAG: PhoPQ-activated protein PqaA family protein, partial [Flavobacteriaceae bacterium]
MHQTKWWHWVDVVIPKELNSNHALLFIGGGSVDRNDIQLDSMAIAEAVKTQSVIAHISNVP